MEIVVTSAEQAAETLSADHLEGAMQAIRQKGYVVLADVIDHAHLDLLRERMTEDSQKLLAAQKWGGAGRVEGHLQQGPPPFAPYVFRDVVANPFAMHITHSILGDGVYNRFYNGNANCPGSGTQPLHADNAHLWQNVETTHPPAALIINVTLVDATEENGATEMWPGTHMIPINGQHVAPVAEAQRREVAPPVRARARKGSLLIRDARLWHRGVPNHSNTIRHMIAMIHHIHWLQKPVTLLFNQGCEEAFPQSPLDHNVAFTDKPLEYLFSRHPTIIES